MRITKDMLTQEHGFEDGVVIEVCWSKDSRSVSVFQAGELGLIEDCYSFKPLTGPKAIWNNAPAGMDILIKTRDKASTVYTNFYFMNSLPEELGQEDIIEYAPWWCDQAKQETTPASSVGKD